MYVTVRNKLIVYLGKNLSRITANVHGRWVGKLSNNSARIKSAGSSPIRF